MLSCRSPLYLPAYRNHWTYSGRGLAGFSRLRVLPQLTGVSGVSCRRVAPVLHPARFSRKMLALLQGRRIPGTQSGSPVLQTFRIQSHILYQCKRDGGMPDPQNRILCDLGNTKFDNGLGWNLDLLLRLWIKTRARFPLLLHQLAETGQDKFAILRDTKQCFSDEANTDRMRLN